MRKLALLVVSAVLALACSNPDKLGVAPSGPGQTTMARSQSVAIASNQSAVSTDPLAPKGGTIVTAVTKSDSTDTSLYCNVGVMHSTDAGVAANIAVVSTTQNQDGGTVTLGNLPAGVLFPGSFSRIMSTGTTAAGIVCVGK